MAYRFFSLKSDVKPYFLITFYSPLTKSGTKHMTSCLENCSLPTSDSPLFQFVDAGQAIRSKIKLRIQVIVLDSI